MSDQYQTSMITSQAEDAQLTATVLLPGVRVWNQYTKRLHMGDGETAGGVIINVSAAVNLAALRATTPSTGMVLYGDKVFSFKAKDFSAVGEDGINIIKQNGTPLAQGAWLANYGVPSITARMDGSGVSTTLVAASIAAATTNPNIRGMGLYKPPGITYIAGRLSDINKLGVRLYGDGLFIEGSDTTDFTTRRLVTSYADDIGYIIGAEYSMTIPAVMASGGVTLRIDMFGDSTTGPFAVGNPLYVPDKLISRAAYDAGFTSVDVANNYVNGSVSAGMDVTLIRANSHAIVINYGVNDMGEIGDAVTLYRDRLDAKLAQVRATYPYPNDPQTNGTTKDIYLLSPNSCNSWQDGRSQFRYEQLRYVLIGLARKYQCTFVDKYAFMQDSTNAKPWMDENSNGTQSNIHIHPTNLGNNKIWSIVTHAMFGQVVAPARSNSFHNKDQFVPCLVTDAPSTFTAALNINRCSGANWPFAIAFVVTTVSADKLITQTIYRYEPNGTAPPRTATRINNSAATWGPWSTAETVIAGQNGWVGDAATALRVDTEGKLTARGALVGGTKTVDTLLFTVPVALRPPFNEIFFLTGQVTASGTAVQVPCLYNAASGQVTLYGAATTADTIFLGQMPGTVTTS